MRDKLPAIFGALAACLAAFVVAPAATDAREPTFLEALTADVTAVFWDPDRLEYRRAQVRPVAMQQPEQPFDPTPAPALTDFSPDQPFDPGIGGASNYRFDIQPQDPNAPSYSTIISGASSRVNAFSDAVSALEQSSSAALNAQQRSPISLDPHIRGYRIGQIHTQADGAFYFPARNDLDTVLSKIDPALIQNVVIVPGPYALRYGPGFSFIDVQTFDSPRYANGYETHGRTGFDYRTNGGQVFGRQSIWGGSSDWGYILSYGGRNGADYLAGDGTRIPASYLAHNISLQVGFDLSLDSRIEIRGSRLEQTNTEYALQFFDIDFLATDALTVSYINDNPFIGRRLRADAWWNNTRFKGDTANSGKQTFGPINRVDAALDAVLPGASLFGQTSGDFMSTGVREAITFGDQADGDVQVEVGADARYLTQSSVERFFLDGAPPPLTEFPTNQPLSNMFDVGGFIDVTLPWLPYFTSSLGYRIDYVTTDARAAQLILPTSLAGAPASLPQNDMLHTFYLMNDLAVTDVWSVKFGGGHAERVPTLTDRYADQVFLGIIQSGLSRVIGDPNLAKESLWQVDLGIGADYDLARAEINGFYSWIDNYITYTADPVLDPSGARRLTAINTGLGILQGVNAKVEADWTQQVTSYATAVYVKGDDITIGQPLAQIFPLDTRVGLRINSYDDGQTWGLDGGVRMVSSQNRPANFRSGADFVAVEERTPGFTIAYIRGYYNWSENLHFVGGVENIFDRKYIEHLSLRLPAQTTGNFAPTNVFSPGITPYMGIEWTF